MARYSYTNCDINTFSHCNTQQIVKLRWSPHTHGPLQVAEVLSLGFVLLAIYSHYRKKWSHTMKHLHVLPSQSGMIGSFRQGISSSSYSVLNCISCVTIDSSHIKARASFYNQQPPNGSRSICFQSEWRSQTTQCKLFLRSIIANREC